MKTPHWCGLFLAATISISPALAGSQSLGPGLRWLTVASTKNLDEAMGIARYYADRNAQVIEAANGWFAVVMGPYAATNREELAKLEPELTDLPADAMLTQGNTYIDTAWAPLPKIDFPGSPLTEYAPGKEARFSNGPVEVNVQMVGDEDNPGPTIISGTEAGKTVFRFETSAEFSILPVDAGVVPLDPQSPHQQIVFTRYTGGAHCCHQTWVVTKPSATANWTLLDAGLLDGGYRFEDIDRDGKAEMLSRDNAFLYTFDSYADSNAPTRIAEVKGDQIKDTTSDAKWKGYVRQELAYMEFAAKLNPESWNSNGFLAGWVAQKILLGEGDAAWAKMLRNYQKENGFGPSTCLINKPEADCPEDKLKRIPFPKALAAFLQDNNYKPLPKAARVLLRK